MASPVALNLLHHQVDHQVPVEEDEDLAAVGVMAVERFLPQRRSPGQRSQDSGFSGYSGDSASEGSSNNNSPIPAAAAAVVNNNNNNNINNSGHKRSPLVDPEAAERALAEPDQRVLETDVDAAESSKNSSSGKMHVSRIYIRTSSPLSAAASAAAAAASAANLNLRDVLCEKNIQPVNLSGGSSSSSPDKCVGDKSLIGAVLASSNGRVSSSLPGCGEADRSCDSQTALLLEHKSIVPPASSALRPNMSWKKLSESFRRVISSGRMMTTSNSQTQMTSCLPASSSAASDCGGDESFTDEEKSRMLLLAKRSNVRRMKQVDQHCETETGQSENQRNQMEEGNSNSNYQINRVMAESPQPTSRYVGGPRSSTPRKTLPAIRYQNNHRRQCSRWSSSDDRPRVHWADVVADPIGAVSSPDNRKQRLTTAVTNSIAAWPDNSIWDSDTPSLEIGQQVSSSSRVPPPPPPSVVPIPIAPRLSTGPVVTATTNRPRRGLRMGVGSADRTLIHHSPLKGGNNHQSALLAPLPPPPVIAAPIEFRSVQSLPPPFLSNQPFGLRCVQNWIYIQSLVSTF